MLNKITFLHAIGIAFGLGGLSALAMAPLNLWPILFLTLSGLYVLLHKTEKLWLSAIIGLFFGFGYFGFGLYWIGNALLVEGNPYKWAWPLAVCGMPLMLSPFYAIACLSIKKFGRLDKAEGYVFFCVIIGLAEWLRGHLFTGFPWNLYGYTWSGTLAIAQTASLYDVYLLTWLTVFWASVTGYMIISTNPKLHKFALLSVVGTTFIASFIWGTMRLQAAQNHYRDDYDIVLVQPNIPQNEKWDAKIVVKNFMSMIKSSANTTPQIDPKIKATYIIWPETALNGGLVNLAWARTAIADMLATYPHPAYLITGAQRHNDEKDEYFNSILVFNKNSEIIDTYDKSHLVPFGEYMPFASIIDIAPVVGFKGFETGSGPERIEMPEGLSFSPLICYEIIFPDSILNTAKPRPDFLINVTNDAWYGFSPGPYQHLVQAQFRSIETGIPQIRVANTGFSASIDPFGRIDYQSSLFENSVQNVKLSYAIGSLP